MSTSGVSGPTGPGSGTSESSNPRTVSENLNLNDIRKMLPKLSEENSDYWFDLFEEAAEYKNIWWVIKEPGTADRRSNFALSTLIRSLVPETERELLDKHRTSAAKQFYGLKKKWQELQPEAAREKLAEFYTYKKPKDKMIRQTWEHLYRISRRLIIQDPALKPLLTEAKIFGQLLSSLPEEYVAVRDGIDNIGIEEMGVKAALERLERKEDQLGATTSSKEEEAAHITRDRRKVSSRREGEKLNYDRYRRSQSRSHSRERSRQSSKRRQRLTCILCGEEGHYLRNCTERSRLDKLREQIRHEKERKRSKKSTRPKSKKGKDRAYNADSDTKSEGESEYERSDFAAPSDDEDAQIAEALQAEIESFHSDDEDGWCAATDVAEDLIALKDADAIPKDMVQNSCKWIADTAATSHMTGNRRLFRSLHRIHTSRKVRTGSGRLDICGIGTIRLVDAHYAKVNLENVLYVPSLPVNLVSVRSLCEKGLFGLITSTQISFYRDRALMMKAVLEGKLYVIKWFAKGVEEYALSSYEVRDLLQLDKERLDVEKSKLELEQLQMKKDIELHNLWHRRIGHHKTSKLRTLHEVTDLSKPVPCQLKPPDCEVCDTAKLVKFSSKRPTEPKDLPLELVSFDICGPLPVSINGNKYFIEGRDNCTRKTWVIPIPDRKDAPEALDEWKMEAELESECKLKAVRIDNATELLKETKHWRKKHAVHTQTTVPHTSHQNGIPERAIRDTEEGMRALITDAQLPMEFWDEAATAHNYIRNRLAAPRSIFTDGQKVKSPEELWTGKQPKASHLRAWGCKTISYVSPKSVPKENDKHETKLIPRGREGVFMGYVKGTAKQFKIYAPDLGRITVASTVKFYENAPGGTLNLKLRKSTPAKLPDRRPVGRPRKETAAEGSIRLQVSQDSSEPPESNKAQEGKSKRTSSDRPDTSDLLEQPNSEPPSNDEPQKEPQTADVTESAPDLASVGVDISKLPKVEVVIPTGGNKRKRSDSAERGMTYMTRSATKRSKQDVKEFMELALYVAMMASTHRIDNPIPLPQSYEEAINDPVHGPSWREAVRCEIRMLILNGTFRETNRPDQANVITGKWVFLVKYALNGGVERYKARLVARGFSQQPGIDYKETFAPTMRIDSLRMLCAIIALEDLEAHQIDVNSAFTEAKLREQIYMKPPEGLNIEKGMVLELQQSLYGLKQAAREWYLLCSAELEKMGFKPLPSEPCVFRNCDTGVLVGIYVDDLVIAAKKLKDIKEFKRDFAGRFSIKDLGEIKKILGIRITRDRKRRTIYLDQTAYLMQMLRQYNMDHGATSPATRLPMAKAADLMQAQDNDELTAKGEYQKRIGSVMFPMVYTRPDIAFAAGKLAQFMDKPTAKHAQALKSLMRYLRSTTDLRICYGPYGKSADRVVGFSDADYAGDRSDRKSTSGQLFLLGGGPISWRSRKQHAVSTSTTEAEYIALCSAAKQAKWISQFLMDIGYDKYISPNRRTVRIYGDNKASITLVGQPQINERSKHIDIAYHFVRDLRKKGFISTEYIPSKDMIADGLTKPLPNPLFSQHRRLMGLVGA